MPISKFLNIKKKIKSLETKAKLLYADYNLAKKTKYKRINDINKLNIIKYYLFSSNQNIKFKDLVFDLKGNCNDVNNIVEIILSNYIGFKYQFSKEINEFVNKKNNVKIFVNKIKNLEWPNNQENHKINDFIKIRYMNQFFLSLE